LQLIFIHFSAGVAHATTNETDRPATTIQRPRRNRNVSDAATMKMTAAAIERIPRARATDIVS
jgi:hypothetical protein